MVIKPKTWGFICTNAHPVGCAKNVLEQIEVARKMTRRPNAPARVLVIGASTGYGLAARITAAFGFGAATLGVFLEKPARGVKTATAGWYNSAAFQEAADAYGLQSLSVNEDAFSHQTRKHVIDLIGKKLGGPVDLVVYSLASPVRKLPDTLELVRTSLKPIGTEFSGKSIDTDRDRLVDVRLEPASPQEIDSTIKVMGGEDLELWIAALQEAKLLQHGAKAVAFSYLGPEITWPIYWHGTIGRAKQHLENTIDMLRTRYAASELQAYTAVMKSVVTQASAAIPVMPLYISIAFRIMKGKGLHEGIIDQVFRLFDEKLYSKDCRPPRTDAEGRLRMDERELREDVQKECRELWADITDENLNTATDYPGYKREFLKLFGFGRQDVDYDQDVHAEANLVCEAM